MLRVYAHEKCVAVHCRTPAGTFATREEHRPAHKPAREEAYVAGLLSKAEHIGSDALDWSKAAIEERGVRSYRLLQGMLSLTRNHPKERVDWACQVALKRRQFRYKVLRRLLGGKVGQELRPFQYPISQIESCHIANRRCCCPGQCDHIDNYRRMTLETISV